MTLSHTIKHGNIGLLSHKIQEVTVILQVPIANKSNYVRAILR